MNATEYLLCKLAEEAAELSQACMKAVCFGLDDRYPHDAGGDTNRERVLAELQDVEGVALMLKHRGVFHPADIYGPEAEARWIAKAEKVIKWMQYSKQKGILSDDPA